MGSYDFGTTVHGWDGYLPSGGNKPTFNSATALHRFEDNPFYNSTEDDFVNIDMDNSASYDGEGVDIIIMDTGIDASHPEFNDYNGNSRVEQINWFATAPQYVQSQFGSTLPTNYYTNTHQTHGTMCASAAAGIKHGFAKNARIYDAPVALGRYGRGYPSPKQMMDTIVAWKNSRTGSDANRPVIVSCSFGYNPAVSLYNLVTCNYRGTSITASGGPASRGNWKLEDLIEGGMFNEISWLNAMYIMPDYHSGERLFQISVQQALDAGIHVLIAAGNRDRYQTAPGDPDYDNYIDATWGGRYYYTRRTARPDAIVVGAMTPKSFIRSNHPSVNNLGRQSPDYPPTPSWLALSQNDAMRSFYSGFGSGVDLYACADFNWTAVTSKGWNGQQPNSGQLTDRFFRQYRDKDGNTNSNHYEYFIEAGGTSYAAPTTAGMLATYLEQYPSKTPAQAKSDLISMGYTGKLHHVQPETFVTNHEDFDSVWDNTTGIIRDGVAMLNPQSRTIISNTNPVVLANTGLKITVSQSDPVVQEDLVEESDPQEDKRAQETPPRQLVASNYAIRNVNLRGVSIG